MYVFTTRLRFWLQYPNCESKISGLLHPWLIGFDTVAVNCNTTCSVIKNFWRCEGLITFSSNFLKNFLLHFFTWTEGSLVKRLSWVMFFLKRMWATIANFPFFISRKTNVCRNTVIAKTHFQSFDVLKLKLCKII